VRAELLGADAESFIPKLSQLALPFEAGYQRRTFRRPNDYRAVALNLLSDKDCAAEQARATVAEFTANGF
jgi:hypothetical protein